MKRRKKKKLEKLHFYICSNSNYSSKIKAAGKIRVKLAVRLAEPAYLICKNHS